MTLGTRTNQHFIFILKGYETIQELTHYDFQMMGFGDIYGQGKDLSGLIYDPKTDGLKVVNSNRKSSYVCSHKRQHKPGMYFLEKKN